MSEIWETIKGFVSGLNYYAVICFANVFLAFAVYKYKVKKLINLLTVLVFNIVCIINIFVPIEHIYIFEVCTIVVWMTSTRLDDDFYNILIKKRDVGEKYKENVKVDSYKRYYKDGSYSVHNKYEEKAPSSFVQNLGSILVVFFWIPLFSMFVFLGVIFLQFTLINVINPDILLYAISAGWMFVVADEFSPNAIYRLSKVISVIYKIPLPFKNFFRQWHILEGVLCGLVFFLVSTVVNPGANKSDSGFWMSREEGFSGIVEKFKGPNAYYYEGSYDFIDVNSLSGEEKIEYYKNKLNNLYNKQESDQALYSAGFLFEVTDENRELAEKIIPELLVKKYKAVKVDFEGFPEFFEDCPILKNKNDQTMIFINFLCKENCSDVSYAYDYDDNYSEAAEKKDDKKTFCTYQIHEYKKNIFGKIKSDEVTESYKWYVPCVKHEDPALKLLGINSLEIKKNNAK